MTKNMTDEFSIASEKPYTVADDGLYVFVDRENGTPKPDRLRLKVYEIVTLDGERFITEPALKEKGLEKNIPFLKVENIIQESCKNLIALEENFKTKDLRAIKASGKTYGHPNPKAKDGCNVITTAPIATFNTLNNIPITTDLEKAFITQESRNYVFPGTGRMPF